MSYGQQPSTPQLTTELLNCSEPDRFLAEKYLSLLEGQTEQLQFCKQYLHHCELKKQIKSIQMQILQIHEHLNSKTNLTTPKRKRSTQQKNMKQEQNSQSNPNTNLGKRPRRAASQISRHFLCPVESCKKDYGSEGSLNQHIKLKHSFLVKTYSHSNSNQNAQQHLNQSSSQKIEKSQLKIQ